MGVEPGPRDFVLPTASKPLARPTGRPHDRCQHTAGIDTLSEPVLRSRSGFGYSMPARGYGFPTPVPSPGKCPEEDSRADDPCAIAPRCDQVMHPFAARAARVG